MLVSNSAQSHKHIRPHDNLTIPNFPVGGSNLQSTLFLLALFTSISRNCNETISFQPPDPVSPCDRCVHVNDLLNSVPSPKIISLPENQLHFGEHFLSVPVPITVCHLVNPKLPALGLIENLPCVIKRERVVSIRFCSQWTQFWFRKAIEIFYNLKYIKYFEVITVHLSWRLESRSSILITAHY
jgi:hypothetical protein